MQDSDKHNFWYFKFGAPCNTAGSCDQEFAKSNQVNDFHTKNQSCITSRFTIQAQTTFQNCSI